MTWVEVTPKRPEGKPPLRPGICVIRKATKKGEIHGYEAYFNKKAAIEAGLVPGCYFRLYADQENCKIGIQPLNGEKPSGGALKITQSGMVRCYVTQAAKLLGIKEGYYSWTVDPLTKLIVIDVREPVDPTQVYNLRARR